MRTLQRPIILAVAFVFTFLSVWGLVDYSSVEHQRPPEQMLADTSVAPLPKKEQKNERRMDKNSRKKKRTPKVIVVNDSERVNVKKVF